MRLKPRGRPVDRADREARQAILLMFSLMGPTVGLPTLQDIFPDIARSQLVEMQRRYRFAYRKNNRVLLHALRWTRPGSVWAMDFSDAPCAIDGTYEKILMVTDLASREKLFALPAVSADAITTRQALEALFRWHEAPLVMKSDNGSSFVAEEVTEFLRSHGVLPLLSPPGTPRYNGSVEAGIGSVKTRAHYESARHDRPGVWTCGDVEAARLAANETGHPEGQHCPTPDVAWSRREPVTLEERHALHDTYRRFERLERQERSLLPDVELSRREQASIDRIAISRALIERGLLLVRRRRITPPFSQQLLRKIS
jgi:transposase InsO family protein